MNNTILEFGTSIFLNNPSLEINFGQTKFLCLIERTGNNYFLGVYILSQSYNAARKWPVFYTPNCCWAVYVRKICSTNQEESFVDRIRCLQHGSVSFCLIGQKGFWGPRTL